MNKKHLGILILCILFQERPLFLWAEFGASSTFAKINIGNIEAGRIVRVSSIRQPISVTNTNDIPVTLTLRLNRPPKEEVDDGFEPVPSITWAVLEKNEFLLGPGESATTDVILKPSIEEKFREKNYQLHVLSRIVSSGNVRIVLVHKIQFTVGKESTVSRHDIIKNSKFKIRPSFVDVNNVDLGRLSIDPFRVIVIQNTDSKPHRYRVRTFNPEASSEFDGHSTSVVAPAVQQANGKDAFVLRPGESKTINPSNGMTLVFDSLLPRNWISLGVKEFSLKPGEKKTLPINIFLPPYDPLKNKKFIPLVRITQLDNEFPSSLVPIYVATSGRAFDDPVPQEFPKSVFVDVRMEAAN